MVPYAAVRMLTEQQLCWHLFDFLLTFRLHFTLSANARLSFYLIWAESDAIYLTLYPSQIIIYQWVRK